MEHAWRQIVLQIEGADQAAAPDQRHAQHRTQRPDGAGALADRRRLDGRVGQRQRPLRSEHGIDHGQRQRPLGRRGGGERHRDASIGDPRRCLDHRPVAMHQQQHAVLRAGMHHDIGHQRLDQPVHHDLARQRLRGLYTERARRRGQRRTGTDHGACLAVGTGVEIGIARQQPCRLVVGAPAPVAVVRAAVVLTGRGMQTVALAQHRGQFVGQRLFMHEAGGLRGVGRALVADQRGQWVAAQPRDLAIEQRQLALERQRIERSPLRKALALALQRGDGLVGIQCGRRTAGIRQRQKQAAIRHVDMRGSGPDQGLRLRQAAASALPVVQVCRRHAVIQPDPEARRQRVAQAQPLLDTGPHRRHRSVLGHCIVAGAQALREVALRVQDQFDVAVLNQPRQFETALDLLLDQPQMLAHRQQVGGDMVAGVARHADVAGRAPQRDRALRVFQRVRKRPGPGADLVERDQRGDALCLVAMAVDQRQRGEPIGQAVVVFIVETGDEHAEPRQAVGRFGRRAVFQRQLDHLGDMQEADAVGHEQRRDQRRQQTHRRADARIVGRRQGAEIRDRAVAQRGHDGVVRRAMVNPRRIPLQPHVEQREPGQRRIDRAFVIAPHGQQDGLEAVHGGPVDRPQLAHQQRIDLPPGAVEIGLRQQAFAAQHAGRVGQRVGGTIVGPRMGGVMRTLRRTLRRPLRRTVMQAVFQ